MTSYFRHIMRLQQGFTLLEMLVSIGIFSLISAIVIFNHGKFNSSIVVTNLAYEVALSIRQAQVYGLAVKQDPTSPEEPVDYAYGIYFSTVPDEARRIFYIFADKNGDNQFDPDEDPCDGSSNTECQEMIEIQRGDIQIQSLQTTNSVQHLTILFLRPNPIAIIRDEDSTGSAGNRERAIIELYSERADKSKEIVVELSGQISVQDPE